MSDDAFGLRDELVNNMRLRKQSFRIASQHDFNFVNWFELDRAGRFEFLVVPAVAWVEESSLSTTFC